MRLKNMVQRLYCMGISYDDAYDHALSLVKKHEYTFIHPYDDQDVIAGQELGA